MDPVAALATIRDHTEALDVRLDALRGLASWLQLGGFVPAGLDGPRVLRFAITIGTLCDEYVVRFDDWPRHVVLDLLTKI